MKKFSLKFLDSKVEALYQSTNKHFVTNNLYLCYKLEIIFCVIMLVIQLITNGFSVLGFISIIVYLLFVGAFFMVKKCLNQYVFQILLIIICFSIGIIITELIKISKIENIHFHVGSIFLALICQFFLSVTLLARLVWIYSSVGYALNIAYMMFRLMTASDYLLNIIISSILLIIMFALITYRNEKTYREYFKNLHDSNMALRKFKDIIQFVLPGSIFILNYEKNEVAFMNKKATKLLLKDTIKEQEQNQTMPLETLNDEKPIISPSDEKKSRSIETIEETFKKYKVYKNGNDFSFGFEEFSLPEIIKIFFNSKIRKEVSKKYQELIKEDYLNLHVIDDQGTENENEKENKFLQTNFYEITVTTIDWDSKPCIILIFHDQTKARHLIELINQDKYKNQMLATISHDLRTPLNGIIGMILTVYTAIKDEILKKNLKIAFTSANLLNYLISDILDFSQIKYKRLRIKIEKFDVNNLIKEIYKLMKFQANKKKIDFRKEIELNDRILYSDPLRIKQILLNLLGNAIKFTNEGGSIILRVEQVNIDCFKESDEIEKIIKFSVIDTGIGIEEEDKSKLFVLFGKLNNSDSEINKTGIGFGLTISMNLSRLLYSGPESGINVKSEFGKGSTFSFMVSSKHVRNENFSKTLMDENIVLMPNHDLSPKLMRERKENKNIQSFSNLQTNESIKNKNQFKILIVDDDAINLMILETYLKYYNLRFCTALNGAEAFEIVQNDIKTNTSEIKLILMDCNMPVMNGFQASEKINEFCQKNKLKEIPIVAVTANVTNSDMEKCLESGMKFFLGKPVSRLDLGLLLEKILNINLII